MDIQYLLELLLGGIVKGSNGGSACFLGRIDYKYSHVAECFGKSTAFTALYPQIRGFFSQ